MKRTLNDLSYRIAELTGWRRNLLAFTLGICATLTLAPFYLFPLIVPAFTGLLWLLDADIKDRRAFADGWWWGWGFYITGLYWLCIALLTDAEKFAWLIPFALFGITAVIALYCGAACWLTARLRLQGVSRIVVFAIIWTCVEYVRGHALSGFPWNLEGYAFGVSDITLQLASIFGAYGLTFWAVLLGGSVAALGARRGTGFVCGLWALLFIGMIWGVWRLHEADLRPADARYVQGVRLRLVQGNVPQSDKWDPQTMQAGVRQYVQLTQGPGIERITHVIWPETAVPYVIKPGTVLAHALGGVVPSSTLLITGALRAEGEGKDWQVWNNLIAINHDSTFAGWYDKSKLVPFGEFLPLRSVLPKAWLTPVGDTDFSAGPGAQTLSWPGLPLVSPLICYEVIFPERVVETDKPPEWLLNVTNDAWFGLSTGPHQHFQMARMRAVEQGLPLVRVANTGITAVIDPFGRIVSMLALGTRGILDSSLPAALPHPPLYNHFPRLFLIVLLSLAALLTARQKLTQKN